MKKLARTQSEISRARSPGFSWPTVVSPGITKLLTLLLFPDQRGFSRTNGGDVLLVLKKYHSRDADYVVPERRWRGLILRRNTQLSISICVRCNHFVSPRTQISALHHKTQCNKTKCQQLLLLAISNRLVPGRYAAKCICVLIAREGKH